MEWRARLDEIAALRPRRIHPGRGLSGGPELVDAQRRYFDVVVQAVSAENPKLPLDEAALPRARQAIVAAYPTLRFPGFLSLGLSAEWRRQALVADGAKD